MPTTPTTPATPRILTDLALAAAQAADSQGGALWRLAEPGRQLDANLVRLPAGAAVGEHAEDDLDVLLLVVEGSGVISLRAGDLALEPHALVWLPRSARRSLSAGPQGLSYLTVHQRRPGLGIRNAVGGALAVAGEGGEAPCLLDRICPACDRVSSEPGARYCSRCGEPLPVREA